MLIIEHIIRYIAPHHCISCGNEGALLCKNCINQLPSPPLNCYRCAAGATNGICHSCKEITHLDAVIPATSYQDVAKQLLWKLKFERARAGAKDIAAALSLHVNPEDFDLVTYVPTANQRVRQRGYDQAELIATYFATQQKLPCRRLLARTNNERQVGANAQQRIKQASSAFRLLAQHAMQNKRILIIDDVITTGASFEAVAALLYEAGAKSITALVFARADKGQ